MNNLHFQGYKEPGLDLRKPDPVDQGQALRATNAGLWIELDRLRVDNLHLRATNDALRATVAAYEGKVVVDPRALIAPCVINPTLPDRAVAHATFAPEPGEDALDGLGGVWPV